MRRILGGVARLPDLQDDDELLNAVTRSSYRGDASGGDVLYRGLDVFGGVVTPIHDQEILDAADDEQLAVGQEAQVPGPQPGAFGCAR